MKGEQTMFEMIRDNQLNIMLALGAICVMMAVLLVITRSLARRRKWILVIMDLIATFLISFDRASYVYAGDETRFGSFMVRLSNFMDFFLIPAIILSFSLYIADLLTNEGKMKNVPRRLKLVNIGSVIGMLMVALSAFTGLYYYFDEHNIYKRGQGYLLSYVFPVVLPIILYTVIREHKKSFSKLIYTSLVIYIFLPISVSMIQIFTYGISVISMSMVLVSVLLYIFTYLNINIEAEKAHETEVSALQREQRSMKSLFDQTVTAFVAAVEKRDSFIEGHSVKVAETAKRIAAIAGKNDDECSEVYYAALLHDVGMMGIPDSVMQKTEGLTEDELKQKMQKPLLSAEILSSITEYPYLSESARYCHERYDGKGYPDGLSGEDIPEISRIIAVADAYDTMISGRRSHAPMSYQVVREEFIKDSGLQFDPKFADIMVQIMDSERSEHENDADAQAETELGCNRYRDKISAGIPVEREITRISFRCEPSENVSSGSSAPSIILFDSYDRHVHSDVKTIASYHYTEYGEMWFDGHYISTNARNIKVSMTEGSSLTDTFEITAGRYEDHISLCMTSPQRTVDIIIALPDNSKSSYIGLTGENCLISGISIEKTGKTMNDGDIRKIVSRISYTDRLESDLPNIQIDHKCDAATEGVTVNNEVILDFHTMSLPSAELVWHCPYIVLFYSDDKKVNGKGYREYALIKINGEVSGNNSYARNKLVMKKNSEFPGWDQWKKINKEGMECSVRLVKKGNRIIVNTENLGIAIDNTTFISDGTDTVYAALTGNRIALTDIRIK